MKFKFSIRGTSLYNKMWATPKGRVSAWIKAKCDGLSHRDRVNVVAVLLAVFIVTAFCVFGHACYKIGKGDAKTELEIDQHIKQLELFKPDSSKFEPILPAYGSETETE